MKIFGTVLLLVIVISFVLVSWGPYEVIFRGTDLGILAPFFPKEVLGVLEQGFARPSISAGISRLLGLCSPTGEIQTVWRIRSFMEEGEDFLILAEMEVYLCRDAEKAEVVREVVVLPSFSVLNLITDWWTEVWQGLIQDPAEVD